MTRSTCRWLASIELLAVVLLMLGCQRDGVTFVGFAGGPPGGSFFPVAGAIATYSEQHIPNLSVSVEGSGGSGENIRLVSNGDAGMGIAFAGDLHTGYFGQEDFAGAPQTNLRAVGMVFWSYGHVVTLRRSGIRSVADLENKRVALGGTGTGSALTGERFFRHLGLLQGMRTSYLGGTVASAALKDGQIDAYNWHSGAPNSAVLDTLATHEVTLLDLATPARESGFLNAYPFYALGEIPAGTYTGVTEPVPTLLAGTYWFVHRNVPDEIVYEMTRLAYSDEGHRHMVQSFRPLVEMTREQALRGLTIPLHPGAQRFWEEVGLEIPERIRAR